MIAQQLQIHNVKLRTNQFFIELNRARNKNVFLDFLIKIRQSFDGRNTFTDHLLTVHSFYQHFNQTEKSPFVKKIRQNFRVEIKNLNVRIFNVFCIFDNPNETIQISTLKNKLLLCFRVINSSNNFQYVSLHLFHLLSSSLIFIKMRHYDVG